MWDRTVCEYVIWACAYAFVFRLIHTSGIVCTLTSFQIFRKVIITNLLKKTAVGNKWVLKRYALGNRWVEDKWKSNVGRITCVVKFYFKHDLNNYQFFKSVFPEECFHAISLCLAQEKPHSYLVGYLMFLLSKFKIK